MANFEQTVILVFPLLTLNNWMLAGCFHQSTTYLKSTSTAFVWHIMEQKYGAFNVNFELSPYHNPSVIRQKGESQNRDKKKSEYAKFSEKQTFLTLLIRTRTTCSFFGKFGVLCFVISVLRFVLLPYYQRINLIHRASTIQTHTV